ncbi:MAG TPA: mechanosensitive ion channel domain-containing protein [Alphaproteobacteria bacterium]|nr:mechanosensitive ion channel domain-containing protein [Alphaproteobacteria bacterium]
MVEALQGWWSWVAASFALGLTPEALIGIGGQLALVGLAYLAARRLRRAAAEPAAALAERLDPRLRPERLAVLAGRLAAPAIWLALVALMAEIAEAQGWPREALRIARTLLLAWIVIRGGTALLHSSQWTRALTWAVWSLVALEVLGLLDPLAAGLDRLALQVGALRLSALTVVKGLLVLGLLLWGALALSRVAELRLEKVGGLSPSIQVLLGKLVRLALVGIAVVVALGSVGIDLTALAVFGGAIGVGIGFGLQKVVSNLLSGLILLLDKSIKPGDVIQIDTTFGWITRLHARYVSVRSRDGREYLIPNEDLITNRVVNWSYSTDLIRLEVPVGVSYDADPHLVQRLLLEAAAKPSRVMREPKPVCNLTGFGDSAVEFNLRFWIRDPRQGVQNIKSEVLFAVWDALKAAGIAIPYPQRDLNFSRPVPVRIEGAGGEGSGGAGERGLGRQRLDRGGGFGLGRLGGVEAGLDEPEVEPDREEEGQQPEGVHARIHGAAGEEQAEQAGQRHGEADQPLRHRKSP